MPHLGRQAERWSWLKRPLMFLRQGLVYGDSRRGTRLSRELRLNP